LARPAGVSLPTERVRYGTFAVTVVGLAVVTVAACLLPGRDALRVDPMLVLRDE
jgi:ABC-type lipoprotein release transport system permease subunit